MQTTLASDADILGRIVTFIGKHSLPPTTFGRKAVGDPNLIANLQEGRELRRATQARVVAFMETFEQPATEQARAA